MALTLGMVTVDTTDAKRLGDWWAEQLGAEVVMDEPAFRVLSGGGLPCVLAFQQVESVTPGKNKLHLDLSAPDLDAEVDRLVAAGATLVERRSDDHVAWVTMTDPDGNDFDVAAHDEAAAAY